MINEQVLNDVYAYIDSKKDDIIKELCDIASIKSVSDASSDVKPFGQGCIDCLNAMLKKGEDAGFKATNFDNYVGSILLDNGAKENIGLWAHLDVVPEGDGWLTDPYTPTLKDGLLFGRGVGDNKSAAIATFYIQQAIRELKIPMKHNVELFLGTAEETGMDDVKYYLQHYPVPKFSLIPDAGFPGACGEFGRVQYYLTSRKKLSSKIKDIHGGSVFNIIPNYAYALLEDDGTIDVSNVDCKVTKENGLIKLETEGVSKHAASPEGSVNAIRKLTEVLVNLEGLDEEDKKILRFINNVNQDSYGTFLGIARTDDISGQTVTSGTVIRYNDGYVSLLNDCRHCVMDSNEYIINTLTHNADQYDFDFSILKLSKPYYIDLNSEPVQLITKICQEELNNPEAQLRIGKGGTYAGCIPNAIATGATLPMGEVPEYIKPGHGSAHQPDEYISVEGYIKGIKLLAKILLNVDQVI